MSAAPRVGGCGPPAANRPPAAVKQGPIAAEILKGFTPRYGISCGRPNLIGVGVKGRGALSGRDRRFVTRAEPTGAER
jgi:hypothetical protein